MYLSDSLRMKADPKIYNYIQEGRSTKQVKPQSEHVVDINRSLGKSKLW